VVAAEAEAAEKGCIAQLQEFVQGSKECPMPSNCSILQWNYDERLVDSSLEFRAKVAFVLDGIPHHALGTWQTSKLRAKRDVAERALYLYVTRWGNLALASANLERGSEAWSDASPFRSDASPQSEQEEVRDQATMDATADVEEVQELARFCCSPQASGQPPLVSTSMPPRWSHSMERGYFQAFVEIDLLGVTHTFTGSAKPSLAEACRETSRRVLWYLDCPGFEDSFEPEFGTENAKEIREAPPNWMRDVGMQKANEKEATEKKTVLMRLQNRLQQTYARQIENGTSAIRWTYERSATAKGRTPLVCATAHIPAAGRSFTGNWKNSQREAQIDACYCVSKFLDMAFPSSSARGRSSTN